MVKPRQPSRTHCRRSRQSIQKLTLILSIVFIGKLALATTSIDDLANQLEEEAAKPVRMRPIPPPQPEPIAIALKPVADPLMDLVSQTQSLKPKRIPKENKRISGLNGSDVFVPQDDHYSDSEQDVMSQTLGFKWTTLKNCLGILNADARYRTTTDDEKNIEDYVQNQMHLLEKIEANRSADPAAEKRRLIYANWIVTHKLSECDDLSDGPSKYRYVYMVGQEAKNDGKSFETIAGTLVSETLKKICPSGEASCARQIALKQQIRKDDLLAYLKLLSPGSMKYIAYIGHGWSYGFLLGFKDMSVPADWHPYAKQLTNLTWESARQGAIYSDDMNYIAPIIARALDPRGTVAIFACDTGDFVAPYLKGLLPPTVTVMAALSGMEYTKVPGTDSWSMDLPTGEHFSGPKLYMYPDVKNAFKTSVGKPFAYSQDFTSIEAHPSKDDVGTGPDDMTSAVLTRIGRKEAWFDWVGDKTDSKRLIVFDVRDRETVKAIFKIPAPGHGLYEDDLDIDFSGFDERVKQVLKTKSGAERAYLLDLFERINACIDDGVAKYY